MASYTTNYLLIKPELDDSPPDITTLNGNFDTIDTILKQLANKPSGSFYLYTLPTEVSTRYANSLYGKIVKKFF